MSCYKRIECKTNCNNGRTCDALQVDEYNYCGGNEMKRSEINKYLNWAKELLEENKIKLPPFGIGPWKTGIRKMTQLRPLKKSC